MGISIRKRLVLLLTIIPVVLSLIVVDPSPVIAAIPEPPVPEFTLEYVDNSYDVPPTTTSSTDPYTNKTTTTTIPGYHVQELNIEVTIRNQPFASSINGNTAHLYYNVRFKGYFTENWTWCLSLPYSSDKLFSANSSSKYTTLSFPAFQYPVGGQVDFQVEAILGYTYSYYLPDHIMPIPASRFEYATSGWSNTQTLTIPAIFPKITLLSLQNGNFSISNIPLDFNVDKQAFKLTYSLDGQENVTISANTTLTGLPNGYHNVTVFVTDEAGNTGASETLSFTVAAPEVFPVVPVISAVAIVAAAAGLLVYLKKRRRQPSAS